MVALIYLGIYFSFIGTIWLSAKVADFHYNIIDTEAPLYFIYGGIFISIWGALILQLLVSLGMK